MIISTESLPPAHIQEPPISCEMEYLGTTTMIELLPDGTTHEVVTKMYRILTPLGYRDVIECSGVPQGIDGGVHFAFIGPDWEVQKGKIKGTIEITWKKAKPKSETPEFATKKKR